MVQISLFEKKLTQKDKILNELLKAKGKWINGRHFLQTMMISQFHSRIKEIEKDGYVVDHSTFTDDMGFKSYRIFEV